MACVIMKVEGEWVVVRCEDGVVRKFRVRGMGERLGVLAEAVKERGYEDMRRWCKWCSMVWRGWRSEFGELNIWLCGMKKELEYVELDEVEIVLALCEMIVKLKEQQFSKFSRFIRKTVVVGLLDEELERYGKRLVDERKKREKLVNKDFRLDKGGDGMVS